jgi:hypothetical protein
MHLPPGPSGCMQTACKRVHVHANLFSNLLSIPGGKSTPTDCSPGVLREILKPVSLNVCASAVSSVEARANKIVSVAGPSACLIHALAVYMHVSSRRWMLPGRANVWKCRALTCPKPVIVTSASSGYCQIGCTHPRYALLACLCACMHEPHSH